MADLAAAQAIGKLIDVVVRLAGNSRYQGASYTCKGDDGKPCPGPGQMEGLTQACRDPRESPFFPFGGGCFQKQDDTWRRRVPAALPTATGLLTSAERLRADFNRDSHALDGIVDPHGEAWSLLADNLRSFENLNEVWGGAADAIASTPLGICLGKIGELTIRDPLLRVHEVIPDEDNWWDNIECVAAWPTVRLHLYQHDVPRLDPKSRWEFRKPDVTTYMNGTNPWPPVPTILVRDHKASRAEYKLISDRVKWLNAQELVRNWQAPTNRYVKGAVSEARKYGDIYLQATQGVDKWPASADGWPQPSNRSSDDLWKELLYVSTYARAHPGADVWLRFWHVTPDVNQPARSLNIQFPAQGCTRAVTR